MRILFASLGLWALGVMAAMAQPTVIAASQIDSVTVYLEGALVHRSFTAQLPAGESNVTFEGLSASLVGSTVVIGLENGLTPLSVNMQSQSWDPYGEEAYYTRLVDSLEEVRWEQTSIQNEMTALMEELAILKENRSLNAGANGLSLERLQELSTYMRTRTLAIQQQLAQHTRDKRTWDEQVKQIERELARYRGGIPQYRKQVSFLVRNPQARRVRGVFSYFATNANWNAEYDIKVADLDSDLQITYKANVYNGTYEDWNQVAVKVSTATPSLNVTLPTLDVWRLSGEDDRRMYRMSMDFAGNAMPSAVMEDSFGDVGNAGNAQEVVEVGEFAVDFNILEPVTLAGNYEQRVYTLQTQSAPAEYQHYAIPKLGKQVYLIARLADWDQLNLLSGQASIYFSGKYTGQSNINIRNARDTLEFSLGEDPQVLVSRKLEEDFTERVLLGSKRRERKGYALYVKNSRTSEIKLRLLDQHPISTQEEIEVALVNNGGAEVNAETGEMVWDLVLAPGQVRQISFAFEVVYPKTKKVRLQQEQYRSRSQRFSY